MKEFQIIMTSFPFYDFKKHYFYFHLVFLLQYGIMELIRSGRARNSLFLVGSLTVAVFAAVMFYFIFKGWKEIFQRHLQPVENWSDTKSSLLLSLTLILPLFQVSEIYIFSIIVFLVPIVMFLLFAKFYKLKELVEDTKASKLIIILYVPYLLIVISFFTEFKIDSIVYLLLGFGIALFLSFIRNRRKEEVNVHGKETRSTFLTLELFGVLFLIFSLVLGILF